MKALSWWQPWGWLVVKELKDVDNRRRRMWYRGRLLIHATRKWDYEGEMWILSKIRAQELPIKELPSRMSAEIKYGMIIGSVDVVDCVSWHKSPWFCGPFGLVMENPIEFKNPIPFKGQLGLFDVPDELIAECRGEEGPWDPKELTLFSRCT